MAKDVIVSNAPPILADKHYQDASVFEPENLLREARRQRNLPAGCVPEVCLLDPDGDIVRTLRKNGLARRSAVWACYHTELYEFDWEGERFGIIGNAVGASFAVLLAEQLFASGCRLLVSITSSGQIVEQGALPYFILIDRALRDEGTSYHYLPPSEFAEADPALIAATMPALAHTQQTVHCGATWTTDAPYRETERMIEKCRCINILAVEMEASALYAFARARQKPVLCLAHVTNRMAVTEGDFEKGAEDGSRDSLAVFAAAVRGWRTQPLAKFSPQPS